MCQAFLASVSPECNRCGGGYSAGLDNYISHKPWCHDDKEVRKHKKEEEQRRKDQEYVDW